MRGSIFVVSGPSGSGKTSLCKELCKKLDFCILSISTTTREIRAGEIDGVDYFFLTKEKFREKVEDNEFLEWAEVHNNFYGTSKEFVEKSIENGKTVVFDVDVQGHENIRKQFPDVTSSAFVTTDGIKTLKERLYSRGTDKEEVIENRIINALDEMRYVDRYDYLITNIDFNESLKSLEAMALVSRLTKNRIDITEFIKNWKKN